MRKLSRNCLDNIKKRGRKTIGQPTDLIRHLVGSMPGRNNWQPCGGGIVSKVATACMLWTILVSFTSHSLTQPMQLAQGSTYIQMYI
jgi:hypothetical protein